MIFDWQLALEFMLYCLLIALILFDSMFYICLTGCAFVTYASREIADQAQAALHNKVTLPTVSIAFTV